MARVTQHRKTKGGKKTFICVGCHGEILPGERYSAWTLYRQPTRYRHLRCGPPTATQLSNSKMAQVEEAASAIDLGSCASPGEMSAELQGVADTARQVAEEYGESADSIEQSFPGSPTAEACRTAQEELDSWADDLEGWEPEDDEFNSENHADEEDWLEAECQSAQETLDNRPEYQG